MGVSRGPSTWPPPPAWGWFGAFLAPGENTVGFVGDPRRGLLCAPNPSFPERRPTSQGASLKQTGLCPPPRAAASPLCPRWAREEAACLSEGRGDCENLGAAEMLGRTPKMGAWARCLQFWCANMEPPFPPVVIRYTRDEMRHRGAVRSITFGCTSFQCGGGTCSFLPDDKYEQ